MSLLYITYSIFLKEHFLTTTYNKKKISQQNFCDFLAATI